jgi:hypothetical protein
MPDLGKVAPRRAPPTPFGARGPLQSAASPTTNSKSDSAIPHAGQVPITMGKAKKRCKNSGSETDERQFGSRSPMRTVIDLLAIVLNARGALVTRVYIADVCTIRRGGSRLG